MARKNLGPPWICGFSVDDSNRPLTLSNIAHYAARYGIRIDPEAICAVVFWPELVGDGNVVGLGAGHENLERFLRWVGVEEAGWAND